MSNTEQNLRVIGHLYTDFPEKFGIPRQSGLVKTRGVLVFEPDYRREEALRGLEGFSHIWLLWQFSESLREDWSPTVRPPRLGGNARVGVFATRSPFRPNPIGLSCVKLIGMEKTPDRGTVLITEGADLMNGTPIFDIKPYLPYTDARPEATDGFAGPVRDKALSVEFPEELKSKLPPELREEVTAVLSEDPRPAYRREDGRVYGLTIRNYNIGFTVENRTAVVRTVTEEMEETP